MSATTVVETNLAGVRLFRRGKVRDVYELPPDRLLIVATDRISAFDAILPAPIPDKGVVLNQLSLFWFELMRAIVPNHVVESDADRFPPQLAPYREILRGRSVIVRKAEVVPFECVVRGYLSGSGWKEYRAGGTIGGVRMPPGLVESSRLPEPFFSPATKADVGHDMNVDEVYMDRSIGAALTRRLREISIAIYSKAAAYALDRGIIIADTKFEFGLDVNGELLLVDEVLTPDSSRFWPSAEYAPGRAQASFDKQPVRDYLEASGWNKQPPAPPLPPAVVSSTQARYREAYRLLVGRELGP
ncbi:MAG: phosphoribosylaminoimidazolesuccinocarboxamide synthase [Acidobacteriota bacterium]